MKLSRTNVFELKHLCDELEHYGDYGYAWLNIEEKTLELVLGDADETDTTKLNSKCEELGVDFTVLCEGYPSGGVLISRGIEVFQDEKYNNELMDFETKAIHRNVYPISLEDYALLLHSTKGLER